MALADRDYARSDPPRGTPGGIRFRPSAFSMTTWLIIINVLVFLIDAILVSQNIVVGVPSGPAPPGGNPPVMTMAPIAAYGHFSTIRAFTNGEVWRFITFQFLHADSNHLLFNMIGIFFFGPLVEQALKTRKRFLAFYLACGICGAAVYLLLNLLALTGVGLPGFLFNSPFTPLVGASAGVFGILLGAAYVAGNQTMLIMFIIPTTVRAGAYILFALAALNLLMGGQNAGGDAAHIGGGIAGYFLIRRTHLLDDFFDVFGPAPPRKGQPASKRETPSLQERRRVDEILEKVSRDGLQSLTAKERRFLEEQSRKDGNPLN